MRPTILGPVAANNMTNSCHIAPQLSGYALHGGGAAIACAAVQVDIEPQELQDMIAEFDRDGDGAINAEEFKAIVTAMDD